MSSLQSGFQKLITDVVTDVRHVIDCTVIAVESALPLGGINDSLRRKCSGKATKERNDKLSLSFLKDKPKTENLNFGIKGIPLTNIEKNFRYNSNGDRVKSVDAYLKNELDNMSSSFNNELKRIDKDEKATEDSVIQYINDVHNTNHENNSSSEVKGIQNIINRTSINFDTNLKHHNSNNVNVNILASLEHKSNNNNRSSIQSTLSKLNEDIISSENHDFSSTRALTKSFKGVFQEETRPDKFGQNRNRNKEIGNNQNFKEVSNSKSNIVNLSTHSLEKKVESMESLFDGNSEGDSYNDVLKQAKNLMEEGGRSNILNQLFEKVDQSGRDIFDSL